MLDAEHFYDGFLANRLLPKLFSIIPHIKLNF
jgi:hypothetical protein